MKPQPFCSAAFYLHDLSGGGVERMRLALLPRLMRLGVRVTLILHARTGALADLVPPGIDVVELGGTSTARDVVPLWRYLRRARPDVLVSSLGHNNVTAMLAKLAARGATRLVICQHNALSSEAAPDAAWKYRVLPMLYRHLAFTADAVVAVSGGVAGDLCRATGLPATKLHVIYNPVIDESFQERMAVPMADRWFDDPATPVFVAALRLVEQKDPHTLLRGFALHRAHHPARLLILGDGVLRGELQRLAVTLGVAADVRFLGFQANPLPFISRAAALLLTSRHEGLGNVLIEALGCGTPVISTNCPFGPAEILAGGKHGALIPVGSPEALASAMTGDLRARWPADRLRRRAQDFTLARASRAYLELFRGLCPPDRRLGA